MKPPVRVLCAANATYAAGLCVMLTSLAVHLAKDRALEIYALATNLPEEDRHKIEDSLRQNRPDFDLNCLHWISPSLDDISDLFVDKWAQIEVYSRLLAPRVLPKDIHKVLYLDSDLVVLADVSPLYDIEQGAAAIHAIQDTIGTVSGYAGVFNYKELGIDPAAPYFNSGVMLINLQQWRERHIAEKVIAYLQQYRESVKCWDQGGLNAILHDSWVPVDYTWNQMSDVLEPELWIDIGRPISELRRTRNHPKIVHYTHSKKPWLGNELPRYSYFFNYLAKTKYRHAFKGPYWERIIGFPLNYYLYRFKLILFWPRTPYDILRALRRRILGNSTTTDKAGSS